MERGDIVKMNKITQHFIRFLGFFLIGIVVLVGIIAVMCFVVIPVADCFHGWLVWLYSLMGMTNFKADFLAFLTMVLSLFGAVGVTVFMVVNGLSAGATRHLSLPSPPPPVPNRDDHQ